MSQSYPEIERISVIVEKRGGKNGSRRISYRESAMTPIQLLIWKEMCDPLTTDDALRAAMLDAALRVKQENLEQLLSKIELPPESIASIRETMAARRAAVITELSEQPST